jgi:GAF domain-containing protein
MDTSTLSTQTKQEPLVVSNWPMNLEATRQALQKTQAQLARYQSALRLANIEIERRSRGAIALTTFIHQTNQVSSPADLLKLALIQALQMTGAPMGAIVLIEPETKILSLGVHKGVSPELNDILTGQQLKNGAAALMPHLVTGSGALLEYHSTNDETERLLLTNSHLTSLVNLPLQLGSKLLGALLVGFHQEDRSFTPAELHFLMTLSQETAIALENLHLRDGLWHTAETLLAEGISHINSQKLRDADLNLETATPVDFSNAPDIPQSGEDDLEHLLVAMMEAEGEVQQQNTDLQTVNIISEMMNRTLDLNDVLQCAVDQTQTTLQTDAAWLYLLDDRILLEMQAYTGLSTDYVQGMQHLKPGEGIEGQAAVENKILFVESIPDGTGEYKTWLDKEQLQALAAVPITRPTLETQIDQPTGEVHSQVVGVLATGRRGTQADAWNPREIRLLVSIANQVALAIDNARLYAQVHAKEASLGSGNEVLRTISDMLLEKNAYLESFVQDDLPQALSEIAQVIQCLLAEDTGSLTNEQKQKIAHLQSIVNQLSGLTSETTTISAVLDTGFDKTLDDETKQNDYTGATKPLRLKKTENDKLKRADVNQNEQSEAPPSSTNNVNGSKPMSFEEAVAAGIVPAQIMNREMEQ